MKNNITIDIIRKEINKWDPMFLLDIAPSDEYEDEIKSIANRLVKYTEVNEAVVGGVIYVVFTKSFGKMFTEKFNNTDCFSVAAEILKGE
jgi:hypothetical protein